MRDKQHVKTFLLKNGFKRIEKNVYSNDHCSVSVGKDGYEVCNNEGDVMYSQNLQIYWLIGVLTYLGYMDKNYKQ